MKNEDTLRYDRKKVYIFVYVYKPKDENKKEKWLWVYIASWDWSEAWSYSWEFQTKKDIWLYLKWFILWMEKAIEFNADVVELCWSNRHIVSSFAVEKNKANRMLWDDWKKFNKLRDHFFSCQVRNVAENKNKVARRLAKLWVWEKIIRKWL